LFSSIVREEVCREKIIDICVYICVIKKEFIKVLFIKFFESNCDAMHLILFYVRLYINV